MLRLQDFHPQLLLVHGRHRIPLVHFHLNCLIRKYDPLYAHVYQVRWVRTLLDYLIGRDCILGLWLDDDPLPELDSSLL